MIFDRDYNVNKELETYRIKLYKIDKYIASILPLLILTYAAYKVSPDPLILIMGIGNALVILFSIISVTPENFSLSKLIHFGAAFGVIVIVAFVFPFIKYEYFLMPLTLLTVYSTYPFQQKRWNNLIGILCIITSIFLYYIEINVSTEYPEYDTFNKIFSFVLLYIATVEIIMTALIGNKYRDIIKRDSGILKTKNDELEKYIESNLQLENFAHIASHDLKTPLSNVIRFSQLLKAKTYNKLTKDEAELFDFIISGTKNMHTTINSLFQFSQASNKKLEISKFSIREIYNELITDISLAIKESKAIITLNTNIKYIRADRTLFKQLLLNLILNSIKFRTKDIIPKIAITVDSKENEWQFRIEDNGIGIGQEYLEKIFMLFKRLHTQETYAGTGTGLAICKTIVEHHNGMIWADNNPEGGSIFYFTISK